MAPNAAASALQMQSMANQFQPNTVSRHSSFSRNTQIVQAVSTSKASKANGIIKGQRSLLTDPSSPQHHDGLPGSVGINLDLAQYSKQ